MSATGAELDAMQQLYLNRRGLARCKRLVDDAAAYKVTSLRDASGAQIVDCGVGVTGGLEAGRALAEVCMADLGSVSFLAQDPKKGRTLSVMVRTDSPIAACMASQYAGWQISHQGYFGMGSGPMRAAYGKEAIFADIGYREKCSQIVGVLEASRLPTEDVCRFMAESCEIDADDLTLLVAPTASLAGNVQVVARSVETALHKMHEIGFDITRVSSGFGVAPLPPVADNDLAAIGRTNDAVLYGGEVTLWLQGDDDSIQQLGPQIPSSASPDHGQPFAAIFDRYERDFYRIDPLLFSPAVVSLVNTESGHSFRFGETCDEVLHKSFGGSR